MVATVAGTAAVALIAACSSSKSDNGGGASGGASSAPASAGNAAGLGKVIQPGYTTKGGTVNILSDANFEHLDPVNNYVTNSGELGRLIYRTLTFIKDTPGQKPEIKPDLAENLGTPSADKKTWTYKLRTGLKFEDGTPITPGNYSSAGGAVRQKPQITAADGVSTSLADFTPFFGTSAAAPNAAWVEYIPQLDDITTSRLTIEDGCAVAPDASGLGIAWDSGAIDARAVARCRVPH
jgi:peptide/nickel transport system substrate-binding protein